MYIKLAMSRVDVLDMLERGRGAIAAMALHLCLLAGVLWLGVTPDETQADTILVSIIEWPVPGSASPDEDSAPDFSPAPQEDSSEAAKQGDVPAPSDLEVVRNASRLADPSAPDRPDDAQNAPLADFSRGPKEGREPLKPRLERPRVEFANPYFETPPGPAQRFARAVQCARLTPSQRVNCPTRAMREAAVASIASEARAAAPIYDPFFDVWAAHDILERVRRRQFDRHIASPYRLAGLSTRSRTRHMHAAEPARSSNQATADMAGRINAAPDVVWGD